MAEYEAWLLAPDGTVINRVPIEAQEDDGWIVFSEPDFGVPLPAGHSIVQGKPAELAQAILHLYRR